MYNINTNRVLTLKKKSNNNLNTNVLYYTIRDLRIKDNWAFLFTQNIAYKNNSEAFMCFSLLNNFLNASKRHYKFLYEGLKYLDENVYKYNVNFCLLFGNPGVTLKEFIQKHKIGYLVIEQFPLNIFNEFIAAFKSFDVTIYQVDAHNIVPVWVASDKKEYNAKTLRIKINKIKHEYLDEYPKLIKLPKKIKRVQNDFNNFFTHIKIDKSVPPLNHNVFIGGYDNGMKKLNFFLQKIDMYETDKSFVQRKGTSFLSPWLHFGMISSQRCVLEASKLINKYNKSSVENFIEEIFIRKELSDNFCYYEPNYTLLRSCPSWAIESLKQTSKRKKFTLEQIENANTDNELWNCCQELVIKEGFLNGYLRMYWCKKILEWRNPQEAINLCIYLNDKYFLDGRDPNGYNNILWCIGGLHDRAFKFRPLYGKVRYMSEKTIEKKMSG